MTGPGPGTGVPARRDRLQSELEAARIEFHALLGRLAGAAWDARSGNPAWTNGQLLFHITLGYILVPPLVRIMRLMHRAPRRVARGFAWLLDASTPLFNRVNAVGPRVGARLFPPDALGRLFDRVHATILRELADVREQEDWEIGMYYPTRWDPRFKAYMRLEDLLEFPTAHFRHHLGQVRFPAA